MSGNCTCRVGLEDTQDCKTCEEGWTGLDCSVALTGIPNVAQGYHYSMVYGQGHFTTFDGSMYTYYRIGEHNLFVGDDIDAQIRMVPCYTDSYSTCVNAFAIQLNRQSTVTIHGGYTDDEMDGYVWINGKEAGIGNARHLTGSYYITCIAYDHYQVYITGTLYIDIYIRGRYLDVRTKIIQSACSEYHGLLGSCDGKQWNDFITKDGEIVGIGENATIELSQNTLHEVFGPSWSVNTNPSLFVYGYGQYAEVQNIVNSGAGYALFFNDTGAKSGVLNTFSDSDVTIEFLLKVHPNVTECGVILSYTLQDTLAFIQCKDHLRMSYGSHHFSTTFDLDTDIWYHVALVWQKSTKLLQLYCFNPAGDSHTQIFNFGLVNILAPGGVLTLGQWNPPSEFGGRLPYKGFVGWIDDFKIWKRYFQRSELKNHVGVYTSPTATDLASYWQLNEGQGEVLYDTISLGTLFMASRPWRTPLWVFSSATLQLSTVIETGITYGVVYSSKDFEGEASVFCANTILTYDFSYLCNDMALGDYYNLICQRDAANSDDVEETMEVLLAYSDHCQFVEETTTWPAQPYCNTYPGRLFPYWIGSDCDIPCVSGFADDKFQEDCACFSGFWGDTCNDQCDGGAATPCSNHGYCSESDGSCSCPVYYTHSNCSTCAEGWMGPDCSTVKVEIDHEAAFAVCSLFSYGHYVMFDGTAFNMDAQGEFVLSKSDDATVYVRQVPCGDNTVCPNAVWIQLPTNNVTFHVAKNKYEEHKVWLDDEEMIFEVEYQFPSGHKLIRTSPITYELQHLGTSNITLAVQDFFVDAQVVMSRNQCLSMEGTLCGNCNNNRDDDFQLPNGRFISVDAVEYSVINGPFADSCRIPPDVSAHFMYQLQLPVGYALYFDGTGCVTDPLTQSFDLDSDVSLEFLIKGDNPYFFGGTLLSYVNLYHTFAITNDVSLKIHYDTHIIDTKIFTRTNQWGFVTFMYYRDTGGCTLYYILEDGLLQGFSFILAEDLFQPGGTLALGRWQPGRDPSLERPPATEFRGIIDEVRIWKKTFDILVVWQNYQMDVQGDAPDLGSLWKMSTGRGNVVVDLVHQHNINIPETVGPSWQLVDTPVIPMPMQEFDFVKQVYEKFTTTDITLSEAETHCNKLILESDATEQCEASLGLPLAQFYYHSCLLDVASDSDLQSATVSLNAYSVYCEAALHLPDPPLSVICDNITDPDQLKELGCLKDLCVFGTYDAESQTCNCEFGYWGVACTEICPGGVEEPCNRHGVCQQETGRCQCELTWSDESNCTKCAPGWSGTDCSVSEPEEETNTTKPICTVFGHGHYTIFDGARFDFKEVGEYYLIQNADFEVQVRVLPCYNQSSCVTAVAVRNQEETVVIRVGYTTDSQLLLWENDQRVHYDNTSYTMEHFIFRHTSSLAYEITSKESASISLQVRIVDRSLNMIVQQLSPFCSKSHGVCGSCDGNSTNDITDIEFAMENSLWVVPEANSLFVPLFKEGNYHEEHDLTGAGHCLHFEDTYVSSDVLEDVFDDTTDVTVEFFVRSEGNDGVILSYSTMSSFNVYLEGTIKISIAGEKFDTGLSIEHNEWSQITIVWKRSLMYLEVYLINSAGDILQKSKQFGSQVSTFIPGGYLALGRWQPPGDGSERQPTTKIFIGSIDEVRIWKRALTVFDVETNYGINYQPGERHLSCLWKFDEGQGNVIQDLIGGVRLTFVTQSWTASIPTWRFSYANIALLDIRYTYTFTNSHQEDQVTSLCTSIVQSSSMTTQCSSLSASVFDFYLIACIRDYGLSNTEHGALSATVALSDYCSMTLKLPTDSWPARDSCNAFQDIPFPIWIGKDCSTQCFFKSQLNTTSSSCTCSQGYWGTSCTEVCLGGSLSPCSQHGNCIQDTGDCECHANYQGNTMCSACTSGWLGDDCSLPVSSFNPTAPVRHCSVFSGGFYTAFDTSSIIFTDSGDFVLYENKDKHLAVQIRQAPCQNRDACITAVAVNISGIVVILQAPNVQSGEPLILVNDKQIELGLNVTVADAYVLTPMDATRYDITGPDGFLLVLHTTGIYINIDFAISQTYCAQSTGLSGPCLPTDADCEGDDALCRIQHLGLAVYAEYYSLTHSLIQQYCQQSSLSRSESLIYLSYSRNIYYGFPLVPYPSPAGYGLFFNNSGIVSAPFTDTIFTSDHLTLQMYVKYAESSSGTLLSYTKSSTFAVAVVGNVFHLQFKHVDVDTGIHVPLDEWLHVSIVYYRFIGRIEFHCIDSGGVLHYHYHDIDIDVFPVGGTLGLGAWQLPSDFSSPPDGTFTGYIDGVVIWDRPFSPTDILNSWRGAVSRYDVSVMAYWRFDSGHGSTAIDLVSGNDVIFPLEASIRPLWWQSDAPIVNVMSTIFTTIVVFPSEKLEQLAYEKCHSLFHCGVLHDQCGSLTVSLQYHYMACLIDIANTGDVTSSMDAALTFSSECQVNLDLSDWPGKYLCNEFQDQLFPVYGGENCEQECYFGKFIDNNCTCNFGYWGLECNHICPGGGPLQPCNGHGNCDSITGTCICRQSWKGDSECGSCTEGWTGADCTLLIPVLPDNHVVTCTARSGVYINYESQTFEVQKVGVYLLTMLPGIEIQVSVNGVPYVTDSS